MSRQEDKLSIPSLLHRLLKYLSLDWISLALDFGYHLRRVICSNPSSPYEILEYEATVELLDTAGRAAIFKKRELVKFLQDNIIAFEDYAWGDGKLFADYKCSPGVVVDRYQDDERWNILISLRETKNRGDVVEFYIERKVEKGFTKAEEWHQAEVRRRTHRLQMNVIFPKSRHCKRASITKRSHNQGIALGPEHFRTLPDGRQLITWESDKVRAYEVYTLKWLW